MEGIQGSGKVWWMREANMKSKGWKRENSWQVVGNSTSVISAVFLLPALLMDSVQAGPLHKFLLQPLGIQHRSPSDVVVRCGGRAACFRPSKRALSLPDLCPCIVTFTSASQSFSSLGIQGDAQSGKTWVLHFLQVASVQFSCSVVSDSLKPHGLQHTRPACPSPTPGVDSNSCPLSR